MIPSHVCVSWNSNIGMLSRGTLAKTVSSISRRKATSEANCP
jgi:hypothetical protein